LDATPLAANRAIAGPIVPQAAGPYSKSTDLGGLSIVRSRGTSVNDAISLVGLFGLTTDLTTYELLFDDRHPGASSIQTQVDVADTGILLGGLDANLGRGTLILPSGGGTEVFYLIGQNQFYFIDITGGTNNASSLFFVSPQ
jgi:hypothetical protein